MKKGFGTKLKVTISSTPTDVPHIVSIKPGGFSVAPIEAGEIDLDEEEYESSVVKRKPITVKINWKPDNAVHQFLYAAGVAKTDIVCSIVGSDAGAETDAFTAFISDWDDSDLNSTNKDEKTFQLQPKSGVTKTP